MYVANNVLTICSQLRNVGARIICETDNCAHIITADIFVERQVSSPSDITAMASILTGGIVVSSGEFQDGVGSVDAFDPAITTRRFVWMSDAFVAAEPILADLVSRAIRLPKSRWTRLAMLSDFVARVEMDLRRPAPKRKPREQLAIVTAREYAGTFGAVQQAYTWQKFVEIVRRRNPANSRAGACGL